MRTRFLSAAAGLIVATPLLLGLGAGSASAAPGDVTATASVSGTTVTVHVVNNYTAGVNCGMEGFLDPNQPPATPAFGPAGSPIAAGGAHDFAFTSIPNGNYHVYWSCATSGGTEVWGTNPPVNPPTAQPLAVTVPGTPPCPLGSLCKLFPGSA